jgi:Ser/Thr protein kinase RdoA (MazF antagonist)
MKPDLSSIARQFQFDGEFINAHPFGFGHINDTYKTYVNGNNGSIKRYILQRVNHQVFRNLDQLMSNISLVTSYLRHHINQDGGDPDRETLNLVPTVGGATYFHTASGEYWRGFIFIEGAQTYQIAESAEHVHNAGYAYGNFMQRLKDFPAKKLYETIPDFHDTEKRFKHFLLAVEEDRRGRVRDVMDEIEFVLARKEDTSVLVNLIENGKLPLRVTHNDTKFNNVMIDDLTGEGVCVIDLDTVMPGLSLYDFGDAIRSIANPAAEDEPDLSKVVFDIRIFEHFTKGYLAATKNVLTSNELELLPFSAKLMTLECGMRFLTDHLNGDIYFKTHRENHNLDRCRTQFRLVQGMEDRMVTMKTIVERCRNIDSEHQHISP